jgi:hypothetical protein
LNLNRGPSSNPGSSSNCSLEMYVNLVRVEADAFINRTEQACAQKQN